MANWNDWFDSYKPKAAAPPSPAAGGGGLFPATSNPGQGAYGKVPSGVGIPDAVSGGISRDLNGMISPEVQSRLQNIAATWGIQSGMPGSGLQSNRYEHDFLGASDAARQRGFENWKSLVPLQQQNNELAAAPNPETRALTEQSFAQQMFNRYLSAMGGGGGNGGGYRSPADGTGASNVLPQPQPGRMGGGIQGPANPLQSGTSVERGQDTSMWPEGTTYDPKNDTYVAPDTSPPALSFKDFGQGWGNDYWDNIFNPPVGL